MQILFHSDTQMSYSYTNVTITNVTIGMTTRHCGVRVEEHLHSKKDSTVQKHIIVCQSCKSNQGLFDNFSILKSCDTQCSTKIHKALLIKKYNPKLNTLLCANSFFLLNVFQFICLIVFGVMCKCIVTIDKIIVYISVALAALAISINLPCFSNIVLLYCSLYDDLLLSPLNTILLLFIKFLYVY